MNIRKLQYGGVAPFMTYTPLPQQAPTTTATATPEVAAAETKAEGLLDEDMIKQLYKEGLSSDVTAFLGEVSQLESLVASGAVDASALLYKRILPKMNLIAQNNAQMKDVTTELNKNGGMYEAALVNGGVMVQDANGNIKPVSIEDYSANMGNYRVITNNELKTIRSSMPGSAFDDNYMMALRNGKGMKGVTEELTSILAKAKSQSIKDERYLTNAEKLAVGLFEKFGTASEAEKNELINDMDGTNVSMTEQQKSNAEQVNQMMSYMLDTIDGSSKTLIQLKAAQSGTTPEVMLAKLMFGMTENETSRTLSASKAPVGKDGSSSGADGDKLGTQVEIPWIQKITQNVYNSQGLNKAMEFNPGGKSSMFAPGFTVQTLVDKNGKPIDKDTSVAKAVTDSLIGAADLSSVSVGGKVMSPEMLDRMLITNGGQGKVYLPIDMQRAQRGEIVPDWDAATKVSQINKAIKQQGITDENEIKDLYDQYDIGHLYGNELDAIASPYMRPFMYMEAYGQGEGIIDKENKAFAQEFEPADVDLARAKLNTAMNSGVSGKQKDYTYGSFLGMNWFNDNDFYRFTAYVPLNDDAFGIEGVYQEKDKFNYERMRGQQAENQRNNTIRNAQTSADLLK